MQSASRLVVMFAVQCVLSMSAFAGDPPKPAAHPQETGTSDSAASAAANDSAQTPTPAPTPKAHESMMSSHRSENTPGGELFLGYSYLRLNTNTGTATGTVSEHFDFIPGGFSLAFITAGQHYGCAHFCQCEGCNPAYA